MISRRNLFSMAAGAVAAMPAVALGGAVKPIPTLDVGGFIVPEGFIDALRSEVIIPMLGPARASSFFRENMPMIARQLQQHLNLNPSHA